MSRVKVPRAGSLGQGRWARECLCLHAQPALSGRYLWVEPLRGGIQKAGEADGEEGKPENELAGPFPSLRDKRAAGSVNEACEAVVQAIREHPNAKNDVSITCPSRLLSMQTVPFRWERQASGDVRTALVSRRSMA